MKMLALMLPVIGFSGALSAETITVSLNSSEPLLGELSLALFDKDSEFPDGKPLVGIRKRWSGESMKLTLKDVEPGLYAIAAYVDEDGNHSLSKNFVGIPTEHYGFSGEAGFGEPLFEDVSFEKGPEERTVRVSLDQ
ncbi:uncharacterized protein (DUF2141 family) [Tamilnaduibacter salinus]|uniref:Uncharacterized protein (DUF2141 family) n=1 Tax=Tamilnaduibacter salinus TaxID=1484056 RepID=A0A2A2I5G9_9GAMM|nr:DUF2141 domain-containing protein [Tamilnaduibacter salinus]PAV26546.1 hypothetical protein CF392_04885 [Tamilnaduibacter salinus]PVY75890.1 uncharacterized protein (DUF2141 family) [Tamilnaduibacter salinus]